MRTLLIALFGACTLAAADPPKAPAPLPGEALIRNYFHLQTREIADADLSDYKTLADWERARPELKRQLLSDVALKSRDRPIWRRSNPAHGVLTDTHDIDPEFLDRKPVHSQSAYESKG